MTTLQIVLINIRFIYDECKLYKTLKMQILFIFILQLFPVIALFTALYIYTSFRWSRRAVM